MPKKKKKKKESWKERQRRISIKHQRALEAERIRRERTPKKKTGWTKGKISALILFLSLIFVGIAIYEAWQPSYTSKEPAPLFELSDTDGNTVSLESLKGKVVILNFFDTHCPPCLSEFTDLLKIYEQYDKEKVVLLSIDVDPYHDAVEVLQQFKEKNNISWPILIGTSEVIDAYNIQYTPTNVIIDKEGYIHDRIVGWQSSYISKLKSEIDKLLS